MGFLKKLIAFVAVAALIFYAPQLAAAIAGKGTFLASLIGTTIIAAGTFIISAILLGGPRAPDMESASTNVKINDPPRWLHAGRSRSGGGALFGEFDSQGRFWYIVVHSDEILHDGYSHFIDDEPVALGADRYVLNKEFRLKTNKDRDPSDADGQGRGYVRIWTTTYSETDPTPPRIAELDAALGTKWTADHKLVGTTFSVICMDALPVEHRYKIYRWRGPFGLGEPAVSVVGDWANAYDPRDPTQTLGNRSTYKPTRNAALIWAWFRTHPFGRGKAESSINWQRIGEQATICDQTVTGIEGTQKRYEAGVAFVDSKRRADCEKEILLCCDGQIVFDEDGKTWMRVGYWHTPTLTFSRNRDIMAMSSMEAQDGESETHGVIVRYIEPAANYTVQPSAAWINPLYYDPLTTPKFLYVDIQSCQNHNQAMRLAKGIGMRSQPRHKIGPTVNLRGLQARHERIVTINYDNTFAGDYEIATPVELDSNGIFTGFGAVPIDPARWTLLAGEEQPKPVVDGTAGVIAYPAITGENVYLSDGTIRIDFPAFPRDDATYTAEYILATDITGSESDPWMSMSITETTATSGLLLEGAEYRVRYRYVTVSGGGPGFEYATVSTPANDPMPSELQATPKDVASAAVAWRNPQTAGWDRVRLYRGATSVFDQAVSTGIEVVDALGSLASITDNCGAGTWHWWVAAIGAGGKVYEPLGPVTAKIGVFDFSSGAMPPGATFARSSPATYVDTTGALVSVGADVPRLVSGAVLLEPASTNIVPNSLASGGAVGTPGTMPTGWVLQSNAGLTRQIVAIGVVAGVTYVDVRFSGTASGAGQVLFLGDLNALGSAPAAAGQQVTAALYIGLLVDDSSSPAFTVSVLERGGATTPSSGITYTGASRLTVSRRNGITRTLTVSGTTSVQLRVTMGTSVAGRAYDFTLRLGLPQMEKAATSSSAIPTSGSAATRAADTLTLDWQSRGVADGTITVRYTFDDGTTQDVTTTVAGGTSTVPTSLTRRLVRQIERVNT